MACAASTPEIRFKGFTNPWEQRRLGDCFTERIESMPEGELISVTINDGIKKFSELGRHDSSNEDKSKYKKVCIGDIAYNSMRMWQGASGYSPYEGIVSPAYTVLSPNSGVNSKCLSYQFKLSKTIHNFKINSQGITSDNWNLKYPVLSEIEIFVSKDEQEQAKIAEYFENLDSLITLHQRKREKLVQTKKALLDKMFPKPGESLPEIRFKGFADPWEQRKLGELCSFTKGRGYSKADICDSGTPLILYGHLYTQYESRIENVDTFAVERENSLFTSGNEVIVPASGETAEDIAIASSVRRSGIMLGGDLNVLTPSCDLNPDYVALSVTYSGAHDDLARRAQGKSVVHVHNSDIAEVELAYPSLEEQEAISSLALSIDFLITLHQRKLELLRNIKKAMLDKMFV